MTISHSSHFCFCLFDDIVTMNEKVILNIQSSKRLLLSKRFLRLNCFILKILTFGKALEMAVSSRY